MIGLGRLLVIGFVFVGGFAMGASELEQRERELEKESMESGDFVLTILLIQPISSYMPGVEGSVGSSELRQASPTGLSKDGERILREAYKSADADLIEDLDEQARLSEAHCDANYDDPMAAASGLAESHEAHYERRLGRYNNMIGKLSPLDQETIRQINVKRIGAEYPSIPRDYRKHQFLLATEYPDEYLEKYRGKCRKVLANRGRPFRKVVQERSETTDSGSSFSRITGYTQDVE